jgi:hypothetical protein
VEIRPAQELHTGSLGKKAAETAALKGVGNTR